SLAKRSTSAASAERRARRRPASLKAARTASDSLRPSRISTDNARSDASSRRALTIREAINETVAQTVSQVLAHTLPAPSTTLPAPGVASEQKQARTVLPDRAVRRSLLRGIRSGREFCGCV